MRDVAGSFSQRLLLPQALTGALAFAIIALLAPNLIILDWDVAQVVLAAGAKVAAFALVVTALTSFIRIRAHRFVIRALVVGSRAIEPEDLGAFAGLPTALTMRFFLGSSLMTSLILLPGVRPDQLDDGRAASLIILSITILGASAIPHYVLARAATIRLIELAPLEPITTLLERDELHRIPRRRVVQKLLLAVVGPVALVGVGTILIANAHLRTLTEQSSKTTALLIAQTALSRTPGAIHGAGHDDAIAAAAELGFLARLDRSGRTDRPAFSRESDGQIAVSTPVDGGRALVRFSANLDPKGTLVGAAVAVAAALLAALIGTLLGRALTVDLVLATHRVRLLGTESVLRGTTRIARPARFQLVARLGRAIEVLTERFRVFAAAQERALEAREAAQRMRGLLFASVSHDLKSPLNAILGFADLLGHEPLTLAQRESLELITTRGRELLALIEAILDTARVEVGQLVLMPRLTDVTALITDAVRKARELSGDTQQETIVEIAEGLPLIPVDPAYAMRAIAIIVAHAQRTAAADPTVRFVHVRATRPAESGNHVCIDVEHSRSVAPAELRALFDRQTTSRGRGLTLGLSLARSIVELHGGSVGIHAAPDGAPIVHCLMPLVLPTNRPQPSSTPALG